MTRSIKTALIGLGNVNRSFLKILTEKAELLRQQYDLEFCIVGVADSSGIATDAAGFDPLTLLQFKAAGNKVSQLASYQPGHAASTLFDLVTCDLVLEASPVNLQHGEPGLSVVRAALQRGIHTVLANKGPVVLAFHELHALARQSGAGLAFSATVCGALPVLNIGRRDLIGAEISQLRGIFNSTTNYILGQMEQGHAYAAALREAQQAGIAESDPTLDVEGWDTANKLVIIANSFLGVQVTLADVAVQGITQLSAAELQQALAAGKIIKLVATAQRVGQHYQLAVQPVVLPKGDFLAQCAGFEMGIELHTDLYGIQSYKVWERDALPTAAALLRDAVNLLHSTH